jgi:parallel beta-helix repeat protein
MIIYKKTVKLSLLAIILAISFTLPILAVTAKKKSWVLDPVIIDESIEEYKWEVYEDEPWLKGSGTFEDPYMIKNIVIDGAGSPFCMLIWNSEAYFKIMDSRFVNTKPWPVVPSAGISIVNTQNGVIFRNQFLDNGWPGSGTGSGIALIDSSNMKIQKNLCIDNAAVGIYLENSDNNIIVDNYCSGNLWGILLYNSGTGSSDSNLVTRNDCVENLNTGIVVVWSYGNTITNNLCTRNGYGISIGAWAGYNIITQNDCSENSLSGIILYDSAFENEVKENDCSDNSGNGILLTNNANNNLVVDNDCSDNFESGIAVAYSNYNILNGNDCNRNAYGIWITGSYGNDVIDNICSESYYEHGILILDGAAFNTILGNICFKNARSGIVIYNWAYNNIITDNVCYENFETGIVLDSSYQNTVENNLVYGNTRGMQIYNAESNLIIGNMCINNSMSGIHVFSYNNPYMSSTGNEITDNDCKGNLGAGIFVALSNGNIITYNNCSNNRGVNAIGIAIVAWGGMNSGDNILCENIIENNERGIFILNADNNDIYRNSIKVNDIGMIIEGQSELNLIYHNNFIDNDIQAVNEHAGLNNWHNIYMLEGNYWSDYEGEDSDGNGIGDEPWPWWDFDAYPFMEQDGWDSYTAEEEEYLNVFFDPESNRIRGFSTASDDETIYIIIGWKQVFEERIQRVGLPPYTFHFGFYGVEYPFQGSFWYWDEDLFEEPGYIQFFYTKLPPNYLTDAGLLLGEHSFQWIISYYNDGEYVEIALDRIFFLV